MNETTQGALTPIACKYCENYATYIEFDFVLYLHEHGIGRGYLDTPPTPHNPSNSWSYDYRILEAISTGKIIGSTLEAYHLKKLDSEYSKHLEPQDPISVQVHKGRYVGSVPQRWSQVSKNSFKPIISVEEFFKDSDKQYSALRDHSLEQSPCYPIIGIKIGGGFILYYCEICKPQFANEQSVASIHLSAVEHHCRYRDPQKHEVEILTTLRQAHSTITIGD